MMIKSVRLSFSSFDKNLFSHLIYSLYSICSICSISSFSFLCLFLYCFKGNAESGCLYIKENINAIDKEEGSTLPFTKGRIMPFVQYDMTNLRFLVVYRGKEYWMPGVGTKVGSKNLCSLDPKCFTSSKIDSVYSDINTGSSSVAVTIKGQKLPWIGSIKKNNKLWHQVEVGDSFGWVPGESGSLEERVCPRTELAQKAQFKFIFDLGYEMDLKSLNYDKALTKVTDPSDVEYSLPNPFYTELKRGSAYFAAGVLGVDLKEIYRVELGVGYTSHTYSLVTYENPSNYPDATGIPFSSLTPKETIITESYVLFPIGIYYKFGSRKRLSFKTGLRVDILYFIGKPFEYFYFGGSLFKQQRSSTILVGPEAIQHKESLELRTQYRIGTNLEMALVYRYSTFSSQALSLMLEY